MTTTTSFSTGAGRRVVFVHAHPDDETLTTGGTMAMLAASPGTAVTLVTCTLGEEGEVIPPALAGLAVGEADQLGGYRIGELAAACTALGVTDHRFLGGAGHWRDSGMAPAGHGTRAATPAVLHPRAFAAPAAFDAQVDALAGVLAEVRPQVVVTYAADGGYGHPDHVRAHAVTVVAVARVPARLLFSVVGRATLDAGLAAIGPGCPFRRPDQDELPSVDDATITTRLDVRAQRAQRVKALRAHATQVALWEDGAALAMSNGVAQPLLGVEEYVAADGRATADLFGSEPMDMEMPAHEDGDGSGLLALLVVDGALLGAFGLAFTPLHVGAAPVPMGALLSILILPWLVLRAGDVDPRPGWAGAPAIAWFVAIGVFGLTGPGGDVMLPGTWQSALLVFGGGAAALWAVRRVRTVSGG